MVKPKLDTPVACRMLCGHVQMLRVPVSVAHTIVPSLCERCRQALRSHVETYPYQPSVTK